MMRSILPAPSSLRDECCFAQEHVATIVAVRLEVCPVGELALRGFHSTRCWTPVKVTSWLEKIVIAYDKDSRDHGSIWHTPPTPTIGHLQIKPSRGPLHCDALQFGRWAARPSGLYLASWVGG